MKNWMSIGKTGLIACAFGALLPGCIVTTDDHRGPPPVGTLTVEWTINGGTNPDDCVLYGADHLELLIYAGPDDLVTEVDPLCEDFSVSVDLDPGRYSADATLVDSINRSATVTAPLDGLLVTDGTDLVSSIDFPDGSFL